MLRKNKKEERRLPTAEEFLQYVPRRSGYEWSKSPEGLVQIKVPKFASNLGKSFCKVVRKDNTFIANMDKMGTIVWENCDGTKTVKEILTLIEKEFPGEKDIDQRLFLFITQMGSLNYLDY